MKRGTKGRNAGSFKAGKSGNPGGRKKEDPEVNEFYRSKSLEVAKEQLKRMMDPDTPPNVFATLSIAWQDRAQGRPAPIVAPPPVASSVRSPASAIMALRSEADTFPEQVAFIDDPSDRLVIGLARRGGKTDAILRKALTIMLQRPKATIAYLATTLTDARRIVQDRLLALGEKYEFGLSVNFGEHRYTLPNGSSMFLAGLNDAAQINKLRGNPYHAIIVDETQSVRTDLDEFIQSVANPALMDYRGALILGGTPDPWRVNLVWHQALTGKDTRWTRHWWELTKNRFLHNPAEYVKQMLEREGYTLDDPRFQAEFMGNINAHDSSRVMLRDYNRERNTVAAIPAHKFHYFCGYDIGLVDKAAFAVWAYSFVDRRVYLVHTYHASGMDITEQGAHLAALAEAYPYMTVIADEGALGKLIALELGNRFPNLAFEAAQKSDKALQIKLMNTDFRTGRIFVAGNGHVAGADPKTRKPTGNFAVHDQWSETIWDEKRQREQEGQEVDLLDAALYGWRACKTYIDQHEPPPVADSWERAITDAANGKRVQHFTRDR